MRDKLKQFLAVEPPMGDIWVALLILVVLALLGVMAIIRLFLLYFTYEHPATLS